MPDKKLKIGVDTTEIKKSILDLNKNIKKELGTSKISIFSKETHNLLKRDAKLALDDIHKQSKKIKDQMDAQAKAIKKTVAGSKEYSKEMKKLLDMSTKLTKLEKERSVMSQFAGGGMGAKGGLGMLGGKLGRLGIVGAALGIGAAGLGRARRGFGLYEQGVGSRLKLRGRGASDLGLTGDQAGEAAGYGLDANDVTRRRAGAMDVFGRGGAGTGSVLQRARFERGFGLDQGTMQGFGKQMRGSMGGAAAGDAVMKMQASLIASGIDDAIGPYLETAATMLTSLNENGLTNNVEVLAALADLSRKTGDSPEIISKALMGVDATMRGSTGERNAFFQAAFAQAGIGGGTIGGVQAAVQGGLFGSDISRLSSEQQNNLRGAGLGGASGFRKRAGALYNQAQQLGAGVEPGTGASGLLQAGRFGQAVLGAKNTQEGIYAMDLLRKAAKGSDVREEMQRIGKDPQTKFLEGVQKSTEGMLTETKALHNTVLINLGERVTPAVIAMEKLMTNIDSNISNALKDMGVGISGDAKESAATKGLNLGARGGRMTGALVGGLVGTLIDLLTSIDSSIKDSSEVNKQVTSEVTSAVKSNKQNSVLRGGKPGKTY